MKTKDSIVRNFSMLTAITIIEKIIAFVFEAVIAAKLGTSIVTDGYFTSAEFFTLIESAFLSAIVIASLRRYTYYVNNVSERRGMEFLSEIQSAYLPAMVLLSILLFALAKPLSFIVSPGYGEEARKIVVRCIRVVSCVPTIVCFTSIGNTVLRQKKDFAITALKSVFISVVGIVSVLIFGERDLRNADPLSFAFVISTILYCIVVRLSVKKYGTIRFQKPALTNDVRITFKLMFPLMISNGIARLALMVDKSVASMLVPGSVSSLTYAHSLYKVVGAIFVTNLTTIVLTDFNEMCSKGEYEKVNLTIKNTISTMTIILIPITVISVICSNDIVKIVYERGAFSSTATSLVGNTLKYYALNFIPVMIQGIYLPALYAMGNTFKPMIISVISVMLNLGLSIPLSLTIGIQGVALSTVISTIIAVILEFFALKKLLKNHKSFYTIRFITKCLISGMIMIMVTYYLKQMISSSLLSFVCSTLAGFFVFYFVMCVLREEYTISSMKRILNFLFSRKR